MRYLALGDSYTIGEGIEPDGRWPVQLAALLRAEGYDLAEPEIIAQTGWTTDELDAAIDRVGPQGPYDLVSLLIGVNNQYRGRPLDEYREQFRSLLARAVAFAGGEPRRVIVLSIPDWGVTPFAEGRDRAAIARAIDAFNAANKEETRVAGAAYVDVTADSRALRGPRELASDGLHYGKEMYARWAGAALGAARGCLSLQAE